MQNRQTKEAQQPPPPEASKPRRAAAGSGALRPNAKRSQQRVVGEHSEREMAGWQAVVVQTDMGIATRWRNPWHSPEELPPANARLLLSTPGHMNGDVQLGEHDGQRWRAAEGVPLECEPALWCLTPVLPNAELSGSARENSKL